MQSAAPEILHRDRGAVPLWRRVVPALKRRVDTMIWRRRFGAFGSGSTIERPAYLIGAEAIHLDSTVKIWHHARLEAIGPDKSQPQLHIGDGTIIQPYAHLGAARRIEIGRHVLMASNVYITDHDHDWADPFDPPSMNDRLVVSPVVIEDYVWLGENVTVLKGVTIGERSIVGAGSTVTKDIPPLCVAVGSPARVVKRYDTDSRAWVSARGGEA